MKPIIKPLAFIGLLTLLDFLFRKGLVAYFLPFHLPYNLNGLLLFSTFALAAWWVTKMFILPEKLTLSQIGISTNADNRKDFLLGLCLGIFLWGVVSLSQAYFAGFSWELRPNVSMLSVCYGLLFIFIADLGTELFMRPYPIKALSKAYSHKTIIGIMALIELIKSTLFNLDSDLLVYAVFIPVLHVVFFSIIYLATKRIGAGLGIHTGANFITISIFDLRTAQPNQLIPAGVFQSNMALENLSMHALQVPWLVMAALFSMASYFWWQRKAAQ